jgi:hypothetical protein
MSNNNFISKYADNEHHIDITTPLCPAWRFDETEEEEADLAIALSCVLKKNGFTANDMQHIFPAVLRMCGCDKTNEWAEYPHS